MSDYHTMSSYDAKTHFAALLARVAEGEEITITKHGHPVARVVPARRVTTREQRRAAIEAIKKMNKGLSLRGLKIKDLINEGRP